MVPADDRREGGLLPSRLPQRARGFVRIIGGRWRARRLAVAPGTAVRPTPDRVRETLFNWLAPMLAGASCLDLFAGTGALGLEALSRGAAQACFVERDAALAGALRRVLAGLGAEARVVHGDALRWLARPSAERFDLVFLDPPYDGPEPANLCTLLARGWLRSGAVVYLESSRRSPPPNLPPGWSWWRQQTAGDVRFGLARPPSEDHHRPAGEER